MNKVKFEVINGESWRKALTSARERRLLRSVETKKFIKTAMDDYLLKRARDHIQSLGEEIKWRGKRLELINGAIDGTNKGLIFVPFDEFEGVEVLFVGDTVFTKYGDELVVTEINKESGEFLYNGGKMGIHRISYIVKRAGQ